MLNAHYVIINEFFNSTFLFDTSKKINVFAFFRNINTSASFTKSDELIVMRVLIITSLTGTQIEGGIDASSLTMSPSVTMPVVLPSLSIITALCTFESDNRVHIFKILALSLDVITTKGLQDN